MSRVQISQELKNFQLLYVEDEPDVRDVFSTILKRFMKKVFIATNGQEGLEIFKNEQIDIIISDIRMPKMTGLEMVQAIREIDKEVPILFSTAFSDTEYLQEAIEVGVDGYLIKPIEREALINKLNSIAQTLTLKNELQNYMKLMDVIFEEQTELLVLFDKHLKIILANHSFKENFYCNYSSFTLEDILGRMQIEDDQLSFDEVQRRLFNGESVILSKNDVFYQAKLKPAREYWLLVLGDVSEFEKERKELQKLSMVDSLTGLYNRKKIDSSKQIIFNNNIAVILFDIDHFKKVNDTYGHNSGDDVLKALALNVKKHIRESDILVRWGGEEFLVVLRNVKDIAIAQKLAEKLRVTIENIEVEPVGHFSASFGVAQGFITSEDDFASLVANADKALYLAKGSGRNRVEVFAH